MLCRQATYQLAREDDTAPLCKHGRPVSHAAQNAGQLRAYQLLTHPAPSCLGSCSPLAALSHSAPGHNIQGGPVEEHGDWFEWSTGTG